MGLNLEYIDGQTPLDEDEKEGLKIKSITTRGELDEFEQLNIERAIEWTLSRKWKAEIILSEKFIRDLHRKMFGEVWSWAGEFRKTNKNIGVDKHQIGLMLRQLMDDCKFWIQYKIYETDEITIRLKHRLVSIHCFSNGNGRHSRLMADVVANHVFGLPTYSWGASILSRKGDERSRYLLAVRMADKGDFSLLLKFAREE